MSDDTPTRGVKVATLQESFALRDEIKQLRLLIAAIIIGEGGRCFVSKHNLSRVKPGDTFTQEDATDSYHIVLTFEGKL